MEFADYVALLKRRWRLIALALVMCIAGAGLATYLQTPQFRTTTRLLVSATSSESAIDEITKRQLASQRAVAYAQYATTGPAVAAAVAEARAAAGVSVVATANGSSPFLVVTVTSTDARSAADVANAYLVVLPRVVTTLDQNPSRTALPKLSVLEAAQAPSRPYAPRPRTNFLVGTVLGALLGCAAAFIREALDATIRGSAELERVANVQLLGVVSKEFDTEQLVSLTRPRSRRTEAYRQVRTNLEFAGPDGMPRSVVVTSAAPGEGKTTLAANLAVIASHSGREVVIVDADLRRPTVASAFKLPDSPGLTDVLSGRASLDDALQRFEGERLSVLTSGPLPRSPSELLGSTVMQELLEELEARFELVVIDTAPVLPVTDALVIAVHVEGVIVVARLAETTRSSVRRTLQAVENVNAKLLGVVANGAIEEDDKRYGYGYGYLSNRHADPDPLVPLAHLPASDRHTSVDEQEQAIENASDPSSPPAADAVESVSAATWETASREGPREP